MIDEGETAEDAAKRELEEETGFVATEVMESSATMVNDPGISLSFPDFHLFQIRFSGMTNANMKFVTLKVEFEDELQVNEAKLDEGEHIFRRVVELDKLSDELTGEVTRRSICLFSYELIFPPH